MNERKGRLFFLSFGPFRLGSLTHSLTYQVTEEHFGRTYNPDTTLISNKLCYERTKSKKKSNSLTLRHFDTHHKFRLVMNMYCTRSLQVDWIVACSKCYIESSIYFSIETCIGTLERCGTPLFICLDVLQWHRSHMPRLQGASAICLHARSRVIPH